MKKYMKNGTNLFTINYIKFISKFIKKHKKLKHKILKNMRLWNRENSEWHKQMLEIETNRIRGAKKCKKRCSNFLRLKYPDVKFFKVVKTEIDIKKIIKKRKFR